MNGTVEWFGGEIVVGVQVNVPSLHAVLCVPDARALGDAPAGIAATTAATAVADMAIRFILVIRASCWD
ncbi:MAG TPA: hypothetical protein VFH54_09030 [Mycobacteriales bacterium]|nr:hypothetical protein [Mycobacteriales bacterium]